MRKKYLPWVEKYRPENIENIVLNKENKTIFLNMLKENYVSNMLFYGPPGTGKTTTIINLIKKYQENNNELNKGLLIHLNASDERGIDIIRNQIQVFVNSKGLFKQGTKFIVLDEVDYMTKTAQFALKQLIQEDASNVRFILICNYISRVDLSLQEEFILIRFSQMPTEDIKNYLLKIISNEKFIISNDQIHYIINKFNNDIRSMINYLQANRQSNAFICSENIDYNDIIITIKKHPLNKAKKYITQLSNKYNINSAELLFKTINHILTDVNNVEDRFFVFYENLLHTSEMNNYNLEYCIVNIKEYVK
jgi:replication factor C subunit 3/5